MADDNSVSTPKANRFGFVLGDEISDRRKRIAAAVADGEPFDGLSDRDVASLLNGCAQAIMAMQTYRGRFLGKVNNVFDLAMYVVGNAMSDDAMRIIDAIAEGKLDHDQLHNIVRKHLDAVAQERDKDNRQQREAERAANTSVLADLITRSDRNSTAS